MLFILIYKINVVVSCFVILISQWKILSSRYTNVQTTGCSLTSIIPRRCTAVLVAGKYKRCFTRDTHSLMFLNPAQVTDQLNASQCHSMDLSPGRGGASGAAYETGKPTSVPNRNTNDRGATRDINN